MTSESQIIICAMLGVVAVLITVIAAIWKRKNLRDVIRIAGAGVFFTVLITVYPYYAATEGSYAFWISLFHAMCAMLMNAAPSEILDAFSQYAVSFIGVYNAVVLALHIIAPLFTLGITLSFFGEKFSRWIYRFRARLHSSYIFTDINERTLCLSENTAASDRHPVLIFLTDRNREDIPSEMLSRIKAVKGLIIRGDVGGLSHSLNRPRHYFLLNADGAVNLNDALTLYRRYPAANTPNIKLWIYTKDELSPIVFDHLYTAFDIHMINEQRLIARQLIEQYPVFTGLRGGRIGILLIGAGNIGLEILRTVCRCSRFGDDIAVEIDVVDRNADAVREVFEQTSPGLAQLCGIRFHTQDCAGIGFTRLLSELQPTYIILALGNEKQNIDVAITVRRLYGQTDGFPKLHLLTDHKTTDEQLLPLLCVSDWTLSPEKDRYESHFLCSFDLKPFGSYETVYGHMERRRYRDWLAIAVNASRIGVESLSGCYTEKVLCELYNQVDLYKNYADAFADAVDQKLFLMGLTLVCDGRGDLSLLQRCLPQFEDALVAQEALRYEAFMRGCGWQDLPLDEVHDGVYQDKLRRRHARLTAASTAALSEKLGRDFAGEDRANCRRLPAILALANTLSGEGMSVIPLTQSDDNKQGEVL